MKKGGYGIVYQEVTRNKDLTPEAKAIYAYLCSFAGNSDTCYPSINLMSSELNMSKNRLSKHMKALINAGVVEVSREKTGNIYGKNIYKITHEETVKNELLGIFRDLENRDLENRDLTGGDLTGGDLSDKDHTNSNNTNNNSNINNDNMVNVVDRICELLNNGKSKAGNKGRLKPGGFYGYESLISAGIENEDMLKLAHEISDAGKGVDWLEFSKMLKQRKAAGSL